MSVAETLKKQIQETSIILYMKGTPARPECGFSARSVQALNACGAKFASVNVLENPEIRSTLPIVSNWPTFPQLFVQGELIGGCDIIVEMLASGELKQLIDQAQS